MKNTIAFLCFLVLSLHTYYSFSQWTPNETDQTTTQKKVGIGTETAQEKLDVRGNIIFGNNGLQKFHIEVGENIGEDLIIGNYHGNYFQRFKLIDGNENFAAGLSFDFSEDGGNTWTRAWTVRNGNVGIGISIPSSKLDVRGNLTFGNNGYQLLTTTEGVNVGEDLNIINTQGNYNQKISFIDGSSSYSQGFEFSRSIDSGSTWINDLSIKDGNMGIGISSPDVKLHVLGNQRIGEKSEYSSIIFESKDTQIDMISSPADKWGSTINLIESLNGSNINMWSIARQTTGGSGDSSLRFKFGNENSGTENISLMTLLSDGRVGIGTDQPAEDALLAVKGAIHAQEVKVYLDTWYDKVFLNDYPLLDLIELKKYIAENRHLPSIPSEEEVLQNGIDLGQLEGKLLQKIEELTLYIIEQQELINKQQSIINEFDQRLKKLEN